MSKQDMEAIDRLLSQLSPEELIKIPAMLELEKDKRRAKHLAEVESHKSRMEHAQRQADAFEKLIKEGG